ncbi:unnamed protein product, partial [Brassica oleracea]
GSNRNKPVNTLKSRVCLLRAALASRSTKPLRASPRPQRLDTDFISPCCQAAVNCSLRSSLFKSPSGFFFPRCRSTPRCVRDTATSSSHSATAAPPPYHLLVPRRYSSKLRPPDQAFMASSSSPESSSRPSCLLRGRSQLLSDAVLHHEISGPSRLLPAVLSSSVVLCSGKARHRQQIQREEDQTTQWLGLFIFAKPVPDLLTTFNSDPDFGMYRNALVNQTESFQSYNLAHANIPNSNLGPLSFDGLQISYKRCNLQS